MGAAGGVWAHGAESVEPYRHRLADGGGGDHRYCLRRARPFLGLRRRTNVLVSDTGAAESGDKNDRDDNTLHQSKIPAYDAVPSTRGPPTRETQPNPTLRVERRPPNRSPSPPTRST